ncbi:MAG: PAS domain S-box protein, partial [Desulfobacteraceae bacterium]
RHGWSNLVPGKKPILAPEYCYAVPKGRKAALAQFSEGLKALEKSGDYRRIREKWLGVYKESPTSAADALRYSAIVIIPLLLIICLAFIWTRSLRRKVAEKTKELMESEEYQRAMIFCSPVALYTIDPDGRVLSWNNSAERIFGWRSEEIIGKKLPIVAEESKEEFNALLAKAANEGGFIRKELIRLKKDGTEFPVSLSVAPVRNDKGETVGILGAAEDITGQKQARLRIEHLNQVLRAIRDINQLIIRERDRSTLISEACRLLVANRGYRAAMIILINEEGGPESWAMQGIASDSSELAEMLEQGTLPSCCGHVPAEEGVLLVENRKTVCKSCPIADMCADSQSLCAELAHEGKSFGYLAAAAEKHLDVDSDEKNLFRETAEDFAYAVNVMNIENARKKFESEHEKLQSQLLQAQKMESVGRLAGGVAHDFNNMLSVITGYAELAVNEIPQENPLHSDLQEILNAARRSADITRQLLAFARQQAISPEVLDLNETVENMMKMLRRLIGEDIDLSWNPSPGLWCVRMDPSQLDQILANLCVNARDAIKDVGRITMETSNITFDEEYCSDHPGFKPGEYVLLAVSDNGRGMDRETSDKIFEPFFTTKEVGKGTGLGLAMIYGIVKQNNGFINVYSEVGRGTTFRIYLPRHKGDLQHSKVPAAKDVPRAGGETVLLVEDEPAILKLAGTILKRLGYKVLQTSSPIEAVSLAKEHTGEIDLLITDVVMPDMNGRDLAERLLTGYPEMKILYMSGYTSNAIAHHGVLDEGVNFLQKPFSSRDLGIRVRRALDS